MAFLDETGLAELWELIKIEDNKLAAADVKIASGSYVGTGTVGSSNPCSLTFDFVPTLIFIGPSISGGYINVNNGSQSSTYLQWGVSDYFYAYDTNAGSNKVSYSGSTMTWYATNSAASAKNQLNASATTYRWIAIG